MEKAKKREALSGAEFEVTGVAVEGPKFDWANYKGKVVLVDFWATWCGPCLEEMSNIRKYYEMYHDQGFEVVGVNLDDMPENLEAFLAKQALPWPVVVSPNAKELGMENPVAIRCGVEVIPFVVLVDRDGKVIKINVTGDRLGEELAKLFKAPTEKVDEKPAEKTEAPAGKDDGENNRSRRKDRTQGRSGSEVNIVTPAARDVSLRITVNQRRL